MRTSHTSTADSQSYHLLSAERGAVAERSAGGGAGGCLRDAFWAADASAKPAARWVAGTLGLGMVASAASYAAHGHRGHLPMRGATAGGLAGLALYCTGAHEIVRAASVSGDDGAPHLAHGAVVSMVGLVAGCFVAASSSPLLGLAGTLGAYFAAYGAATALSEGFRRQEASWAQAPSQQLHGNRWLAGGLVVMGVATLMLGWFAAVLVTAVGGAPPTAVAGKWVGAAVTLIACAQMLPVVLSRPLRAAVAEPDGV